MAYNSQHAKLGDLTGATWKDNKNIFIGGLPGGTTGETAKKYIQSWPDGQQYKGPRVFKPGDPFRQTYVTYDGKTGHLEDMILEKYRDTLYKSYGNTEFNQADVKKLVDDLKANEITFTITPHKISKDNEVNKSSPRSKHIDCTVTVTCDLTFTAVFNAKDSAGNSYTSVGKKVYLWYKDDSDKNNVEHCPNDPSGYTDGNGVQWVFDGWYPENEAGTGPDENATAITQWPHNVKAEDLNSERVVNFYAHYKKATSNVTITKQVTGLLGDTNKEFAFNVSITQNNVACTGVTATKKTETGTETVFNLTNFTLKHNETVTLENVPIGATIKVTEVTPGEHYNVSATGHSDEQNGGSSVTFTYVAVANTATAGNADDADLMLLSMDEGTAVDADAVALTDATDKKVPNNAITVTNRATLKPDTGVLLDTLPYIVILAVVAGGVALLMLRKRRKEDD